MARYRVARDFIRAHFVVVYPSRGEGKTPLDLVRGFDAAVAKFGVSHCLVDPWNKADHSAMASMGGEAPYLVNTLGHLGDWAQDTGQSLIINAHPRQLEGMKHGQARPIPDSSHIAGGQTWENMAHVVATYYRPWKHLGSDNPLYSDVAIYVHKIKSHKLVGRPGSIGDGSQTPDVRITYDWASARYFINNVSPLNCRAAEECYLTDEELRTRDDQRSEAPAPAPAPAVAMPDYQPAMLRTASPSEFEASTSPYDELPADWHPGGRPITLLPRYEKP